MAGDLRKRRVMRPDESPIMVDQRSRGQHDPHAQIIGSLFDLKVANLHEARDDQIDLARAGDVEQADSPLQPAYGREAFRVVFPIAAPHRHHNGIDHDAAAIEHEFDQGRLELVKLQHGIYIGLATLEEIRMLKDLIWCEVCRLCHVPPIRDRIIDMRQTICLFPPNGNCGLRLSSVAGTSRDRAGVFGPD